MSAAILIPWISPQEYLDSEPLSEVRREYFAGDVRAMAGGNRRHNWIVGKIYASLLRQLSGKTCQPFFSDLKVHVRLGRSDSAYYYPDIVVDCGSLRPDSKSEICEKPTVIFEVLSSTTERIDRREKYLAYLMLPELQCYALVEQDRRAITVFRRGEGGFRQDILEGNEAVLSLPEIGCSLMLSEIYDGVEI